MNKKKAKIMSLVGARPQFVKLAPLAVRLQKAYQHQIIHSGQHYNYNLSGAFFDQLQISKPDKNLNIGSGNHGWQTGQILEKFEKILLHDRPDMVLIYGDTNTTLAGALTASKLHIPIGHVEAGLRSFVPTMPEEINRRVADHLSDLLFYPTPTARKNLLREGLTKGLIRSGDLMYEILDAHLKYIKGNREVFAKYNIEESRYFLITLHRAENADDPERLRAFIKILNSLKGAKLFPAHPRTIKNLKKFRLYQDLKKVNNLLVVEPVPYNELLTLMAFAQAVLTDSGGMQKEAYFLGCPCLTLRHETEWVETVEKGANVLVDMSPGKVSKALKKIKKSRRRLNYLINGKKPSQVIRTAIDNYLQRS
ncbi:MAG: UDP-N-acetylglucosamine 2-epimerase (non-hydrolyzing) [candidate division Zixibacteria bacterium]